VKKLSVLIISIVCFVYLNLSEEDIAELNIPDSLYRWALNFVESLNAK